MSTVERWITVDSDGSLMLVTENDGEAVAYRGLERQESRITLSEIKRRYPRIYDDAIDSIKNALLQRNRHLLRRDSQEIDVRHYLQPEELEQYLQLVSCNTTNLPDAKKYEELCSLAASRYRTAVGEIDRQMK